MRSAAGRGALVLVGELRGEVLVHGAAGRAVLAGLTGEVGAGDAAGLAGVSRAAVGLARCRLAGGSARGGAAAVAEDDAAIRISRHGVSRVGERDERVVAVAEGPDESVLEVGGVVEL